MNHFFAQKIDEELGQLSEQDSKHALKVLRLKAGSGISVSFGDGLIYQAEICNVTKKNVVFSNLVLLRKQAMPKLEIAIAPTKSNDRFEWFLEKAVELGIAAIHPIICERSERKVYKTDRGLRIMEAAFKQSHKGYMPSLSDPCSLGQFLKKDLVQQRLVASLNEGPKKSLNHLKADEPCLVFIGPEGDFSAQEIKLLQGFDIDHLDLGPEVLRTETAALHIASTFAYKCQSL